MLRKILKRLFNEFRNPSYDFSLRIIHNFHFLLSKINIFNNKNFNKGVLIWDIRSNPITFDIIYLVYLAYIFFCNRNIKVFEVLVFIPKNYIFKSISFGGYSNFVTEKDLEKRIHNLLIPILSSFNCITKVTIIKDRKTLLNNYKLKVTYPELYNPYYYFTSGFRSYKFMYKSLKINNINNPYLLTTISLYEILSSLSLKHEINEYITFTLRDYGYEPKRNSSSSQIKLVYDFSKNINKKLILIPDKILELKNYEIPSDVLIDINARNDIKRRIALYKYSKVNIFMQAGPADLSHFIKGAKTIILNWGVPSFDGSIKFIEKEYGLKYNEQPYLKLSSFLIWYKNKGNISNKDLMNAYLQVKGS